MRLAERILSLVREPVVVGEGRVEIGASIGIALCPDDGADTDTILRAADIAMYRAKRAGSHIRFFEASMDAELRARASMESAVRRAVLAGDIKPNYQPLVDLSDNRLTGFEILARWQGSEQIEPDQFIPIIEHLGLMPDFTMGMLRRACVDAKRWPANLGLSLNVSAIELKDLLFPARVLGVLSETGFPPQRLEIEITESALLTDLATAGTVIASLHNVGIKVALDDFGTGYSSLSHLRELNLDNIKIDRSFVQSLNSNPESAKIIDAIVGLARSLGLPTTAEGIEDVAVLAELDRVGCTVGQGFLFGKAMPAEKVAGWMADYGSGGLNAKIA